MPGGRGLVGRGVRSRFDVQEGEAFLRKHPAKGKAFTDNSQGGKFFASERRSSLGGIVKGARLAEREMTLDGLSRQKGEGKGGKTFRRKKKQQPGGKRKKKKGKNPETSGRGETRDAHIRKRRGGNLGKKKVPDLPSEEKKKTIFRGEGHTGGLTWKYFPILFQRQGGEKGTVTKQKRGKSHNRKEKAITKEKSTTRWGET